MLASFIGFVADCVEQVGFRLVPAAPTSPPRAKGVAIGTPVVSIPA